MVLSAASSALFNSYASPVGYGMTVANDMLTALYLLNIKSAQKEAGVSGPGLMYYNSMISAPILCVAALAHGEHQSIAEFQYLHDSGFQLGLFLSCFWGLLLVYSTMQCASNVSALATSVTGNIKDIGAMVLGMFLFGDSDNSPSVLIGLFLSVAASLYYSYLKLLESGVLKSADYSKVESTEQDKQLLEVDDGAGQQETEKDADA